MNKNTQVQRESEKIKVRTVMRYNFFFSCYIYLPGWENCAGRDHGKCRFSLALLVRIQFNTVRVFFGGGGNFTLLSSIKNA